MVLLVAQAMQDTPSLLIEKNQRSIAEVTELIFSAAVLHDGVVELQGMEVPPEDLKVILELVLIIVVVVVVVILAAFLYRRLTRRTMCSYWCPCSSDAHWCLQPCVMPNSLLLTWA